MGDESQWTGWICFRVNLHGRMGAIYMDYSGEILWTGEGYGKTREIRIFEQHLVSVSEMTSFEEPAFAVDAYNVIEEHHQSLQTTAGWTMIAFLVRVQEEWLQIALQRKQGTAKLTPKDFTYENLLAQYHVIGRDAGVQQWQEQKGLRYPVKKGATGRKTGRTWHVGMALANMVLQHRRLEALGQGDLLGIGYLAAAMGSKVRVATTVEEWQADGAYIQAWVTARAQALDTHTWRSVIKADNPMLGGFLGKYAGMVGALRDMMNPSNLFLTVGATVSALAPMEGGFNWPIPPPYSTVWDGNSHTVE